MFTFNCPNCGKEMSIFQMQKKDSWFEQGPYCPHCNEGLRYTSAGNKHFLIGSVLTIGVCFIVQFLINGFNLQINNNKFLSFLQIGLPAFICFFGYLLLGWNSNFVELDKGIKKAQEPTRISSITIIIAICLIILIWLCLNFYIHKMKIF